MSDEDEQVVKAKLDADNNRIAFSMPKSEYEKAAWHYDYLTILFYDSETGMFLTKPYMREQEKQMQSEYLSLNEWRELKELNKTMRDFNRQIFDLLGQKFMGILGNPVFKLVIVVLIIFGIIAAVIYFFPQISATFMPAVNSATKSTGQLVNPIK